MAKKRQNRQKVVRAKKNKTLGGLNLARENLLDRLEPLQEAVFHFEGEAQALLKKLQAQGQKTRKEILKGVEEILSKVKGIEILNRASKNRRSLEKEIKALAEDLMLSLKEIESKLSGELLHEAFGRSKHLLADIQALLSEGTWMAKLKEGVKQGQAEIYRFLSLPRNTEVLRLKRKVDQLEKKVVVLNKKAA
ncbi:MAG: hypothetical protein KDK66_05370 [Deltaproteobacteria bacterium]|nr:hypothetical protein [Deltaproteobacteria bacterium]